MKRTTRIATSLAALATVAGTTVAATSAPAAAGPTECEPGTTAIKFSSHSSKKAPAGTVSVTNTSGSRAPVEIRADVSKTQSASVTGSVSLDSVLSPVKAELSATAERSLTISSGATLGKVRLKKGETRRIVFGFETVNFSGTARSCGNDGKLQQARSFSGVIPDGTYFSY